MPDLHCRYLGLDLTSPIVASASPLTGHLQDLMALEDLGAGAVVLPSLFEEEIEADAINLTERLEAGSESFAEATGFLPVKDLSFAGPAAHLKLVAAARNSLDIPVIASLNGMTDGGWVRYAAMLADAGANAVELNLYSVESDAKRSASDVETDYLRLIEHVRWRVDVPLSVKLSPYFSSTAHFARRLFDLGIDGLVLFNRFVQPDIDIETFDVNTRVELSAPQELRLPLRWIGLLRPTLPEMSLALSSGVRTGTDVVKGLLAGADVVMLASELIRNGPQRLAGVRAELVNWMVAHEYDSVVQMRGSLSSDSARDARAYERSQYVRAISRR
jgi:dihydroorotate dehydrogenase (fumarate)